MAALAASAPSNISYLRQTHFGNDEERCLYCGSTLVEVSAYPRAGRRRACLAGRSTPPGPGALPCGAQRWAGRAA
ncbi:MAG TPA: hypothetical protein VGK33_17220 [Chloroflexota bacterium]